MVVLVPLGAEVTHFLAGEIGDVDLVTVVVSAGMIEPCKIGTVVSIPVDVDVAGADLITGETVPIEVEAEVTVAVLNGFVHGVIAEAAVEVEVVAGAGLAVVAEATVAALVAATAAAVVAALVAVTAAALALAEAVVEAAAAAKTDLNKNLTKIKSKLQALMFYLNQGCHACPLSPETMLFLNRSL